MQARAIGSLRERSHVVHPRVVAAKMAAADQHRAPFASACASTHARDARHVGRRARSARARARPSGVSTRRVRVGIERPEVDAVLGASRSSRSVRRVRPGAQQQIDDALGQSRASRAQARRARERVRRAEARDELARDLPVVARVVASCRRWAGCTSRRCAPRSARGARRSCRSRRRASAAG